ncbi:MAG: hypothetical protein ACK55I_01395, partial [bacterium]
MAVASRRQEAPHHQPLAGDPHLAKRSALPVRFDAQAVHAHGQRLAEGLHRRLDGLAGGREIERQGGTPGLHGVEAEIGDVGQRAAEDRHGPVARRVGFRRAPVAVLRGDDHAVGLRPEIDLAQDDVPLIGRREERQREQPRRAAVIEGVIPDDAPLL